MNMENEVEAIAVMNELPIQPVVLDDIFGDIAITTKMQILKPLELSQYAPFLKNLQALRKSSSRFFPCKMVHIFIELFDSFKNETNISLMKSALDICFKLTGTFTLGLVNEVVEENIAQAFGIYLKKLKTLNQLEFSDIQSLVSPRVDLLYIKQVVYNSEDIEVYLYDLDELQYTIACIFIKHYYSDINLNLESTNNARFQKIYDMVIETPKSVDYINLYYPIHNVITNEKLLLERAGVVVGRGTSVVTPCMLKMINHYIGYDFNWCRIYCNKILCRLIIPIIDMKMLNEDCTADDEELINTLTNLNGGTFKEPIIDRALTNVLSFLEKFDDPSAVQHLAKFVGILRKHGCRILKQQDMLVLEDPSSDFMYSFKTNSEVLIDAINEVLAN